MVHGPASTLGFVLLYLTSFFSLMELVVNSSRNWAKSDICSLIFIYEWPQEYFVLNARGT